MLKMRRTTLAVLCCVAIAPLAKSVLAADVYPDKTITIVVPSVAGGAADAVGRAVAQGLGKQLNASVIVDNKPGAGTTLGTQQVIRMPADGYTLLLGLDAALTTAPFMLAKLPYQPKTDLTPIATLATLQYLLVASPAAPFHSVAELVERARANPGTITYASGGEGSVHHLAMEAFQKEAGIRLKHVPYKAAPQGFLDVMGSHVDVMFIASGTAVSPIKARKVQGLGRTGVAPISDLPAMAALKDMPESKGYVFESWFGLLARAGTPAPMVGRVSTALAGFMKSPEAEAQMQALGVTLTFEDPSTLAKRIDEDTKRYAPVVAKLKEQSAKP
ncbi:MAG: tripartite tricarboxylate transporter substrate binding protein [Polaromonas sp.]|uniref:Bug family tripartite tricarboxylate transporter substrate binding protein n=1 Tax=Polaromonas sp. TaxID=1869339 RepID=UPI002734A5DE|nr:tripartite tricarboxylate transporter substrate binding protein [Polaromonas sp.]MDP3795885.1 tripartite tricarboxylate transporter substrate binding protein [Polaromonas sp.]